MHTQVHIQGAGAKTLSCFYAGEFDSRPDDFEGNVFLVNFLLLPNMLTSFCRIATKVLCPLVAKRIVTVKSYQDFIQHTPPLC